MLDICSGSVHAVDELAYDVIALFETERRDVIIEKLWEKYQGTDGVTPDEIGECYDQIARLKLAIKETEQASAELQQRLYDYMTENNLDEMACELGTFVRKAPYTKKALDSTRLKKEKPELYEQYLKESEVKGSITFKTN